MTQPTEQDKLFDALLRQAYQELERMEPKQESYESYVKAEMADHQYKEPRYREITMRDYVRTMERLAFFLPEGVEPTDEQILEAMRDQANYKADMARKEHLFDIPAMTSEEIDKRLNNG